MALAVPDRCVPATECWIATRSDSEECAAIRSDSERLGAAPQAQPQPNVSAPAPAATRTVNGDAGRPDPGRLLVCGRDPDTRGLGPQ